jgi:hypothetical protein
VNKLPTIENLPFRLENASVAAPTLKVIDKEFRKNVKIKCRNQFHIFAIWQDVNIISVNISEENFPALDIVRQHKFHHVCRCERQICGWYFIYIYWSIKIGMEEGIFFAVTYTHFYVTSERHFGTHAASSVVLLLTQICHFSWR